ncbi:MAG TPA: hypothetical protein VGX03_34670 [Candidatus Binatia bacterium]|jgi:hypothetical protein|nr:hypothetical protein [Candidatus Binatia bacterium]
METQDAPPPFDKLSTNGKSFTISVLAPFALSLSKHDQRSPSISHLGKLYLGIHWAFDKTEGIIQGRRVADYVFEHAFKPRHGKIKKD